MQATMNPANAMAASSPMMELIPLSAIYPVTTGMVKEAMEPVV